MTAYRFFSIKNVPAKMLGAYLIFKSRLPRYCRWRHSDVLMNSNLFCL